MKKTSVLCTFVLLIISQTVHSADFVSPAPSSVNQQVNVNPPVNIIWTLTPGGNDAATNTQTSATGRFRPTFLQSGASDNTFYVNPIQLQNTNCPPGNNCTSNEFLQIPASVLNYAQANNLRTIYYARTFSGDQSSAEGVVSISLVYPAPTLSSIPGSINYLTPGILWNITTYGDGSGTISSTGGIFSATPYLGQTSLGSTANTLITPTLPAAGTVLVAETLQIPQLVLDSARSANLQNIYYIRAFYDDPCAPQASCPYSTAAASVQISLALPNPNAVLALSRVALRFSDNTSVKVIPPNTHLLALADISYLGTGLLDATWEIAEPVSSIGQAVFVPVQPVRQLLVAGGRTYLQSPPLPTQKQGIHILRLAIHQPIPSFVIPILQYSVNPEGDISGLTALPPIRINLPTDNALLTANTRFDWQPVKGAHGYQLELFFPEQSGVKPDAAAIAKRLPASGMMVPAKTTHLTLAELARIKLRPNTTYYWRVIAIGEKGQILTTSGLREIRIP